MKKILQISNYQYPHIGGIEQTTRDIADSLLNEDIEQKIICFNEDAKAGEIVCHRRETVHEVIDGVEVIRCGCIAKVASQSISLTYPSKLKNVLKQFQPDIVILHYPNPFVSFFLLPLLDKKTKFILYWHLDITKQRLLKKLFHSQNIKLLKRADKIVATSPNYIEGSPYLSKFREKCIVIPSCIRTSRFNINDDAIKRADEIKEKYKGKTICLAVGRHVPYKGLTYLVQASKYLTDDFKILIGGTGPLTLSLQKEAEGDSRIEFLGRVSDSDLISYYIACDIFAFPSITKNEAFGLALAEGMYFNNPAVTFTIPGSGVNYVNLDKVTGIECPNSDSRAFAEAITELQNNLELRKKYGDNARLRVEQYFMYEQMKDKIIKLINEMK